MHICSIQMTSLEFLNQVSVEASAHSVVDIDDMVLRIVHDGWPQLTDAGAR